MLSLAAAIFEAAGLGQVLGILFLTGFQVMLRLPAQGPCFGNARGVDWKIQSLDETFTALSTVLDQRTDISRKRVR